MNARVPLDAPQAGESPDGNAARPGAAIDADRAGLAGLCWPSERLGEALQGLAERSGLAPRSVEGWSVPRAVQGDEGEELPRWIGWAADRLGLEAVPVDLGAAQLPALLHGAGPALLQGQVDGQPVFMLLLGRRLGRLRLLAPNGQERRVSADALRAWLCAPREAALRPAIDRLLDAAAVPPKRRPRAAAALLAEGLADASVGACWLLRTPASHPFWSQLVQARLPRRVLALLAVFALVYGVEIEAWRLIGGAALDGRLDLGWLSAWALLMLTLVPLHLIGGWLDGQIAIDSGRLFKQRMLDTALRLDLDLIKRSGVGEWLGRTMEAQALESLAVGGSLALGTALLELGFAAWVLSAGAVARWHLALLCACLAAAVLAALRWHGRLARWTGTRLRLTQDLIERMVGHRTRLAQDQPARREAQEDQAMHGYLGDSQRLDQALVPLIALIPGLWIVLGLAALAPALARAEVPVVGLAISLGGLLFTHRALNGVTAGLAALAQVRVAWQQVARHARQPGAPARDTPFIASPGTARPAGSPLVQASGLAYRYQPAGEDVLHGVQLDIRRGERLLLQGRSGGGKSTLASLLVGLRTPTRGSLTLDGLDRATLGPHWQRLATEAPQFHDNHVLGGSLAFNLLMGRDAANPADRAEAEALCRELGLGPLLDRMPAGLDQALGETGWQLSHGEKSRLYLARALLQRAPLTVLDESFAALDPETLQRCMGTALRHADALVVVAHP